MDCYDCGTKMDFNDNSITCIPSKDGSEHIEPIYHCPKCNTYYDGFTAHEERMNKYKMSTIKKHGLDKWFEPSVIAKLNEMNKHIEAGMSHDLAIKYVFRPYLLKEKAIMLSSLYSASMLLCNNEIVAAGDLRQRVRNGETIPNVYTVADSYVESILDQVASDHNSNCLKDSYSAENVGVRVVVDYENILKQVII